jgi:hypothetical protein
MVPRAERRRSTQQRAFRRVVRGHATEIGSCLSHFRLDAARFCPGRMASGRAHELVAAPPTGRTRWWSESCRRACIIPVKCRSSGRSYPRVKYLGEGGHAAQTLMSAMPAPPDPSHPARPGALTSAVPGSILASRSTPPRALPRARRNQRQHPTAALCPPAGSPRHHATRRTSWRQQPQSLPRPSRRPPGP